MATTRNRRVKVSSPVEEKPVEAPQIEEVKEVSKPVEKKIEAPQTEEVKEVSKPVVEKKVKKSLPVTIELKSLVSGKRGIGKVIRIDKINEDKDADLLLIKTETGQYRARRSDLVLI